MANPAGRSNEGALKLDFAHHNAAASRTAAMPRGLLSQFGSGRFAGDADVNDQSCRKAGKREYCCRSGTVREIPVRRRVVLRMVLVGDGKSSLA